MAGAVVTGLDNFITQTVGTPAPQMQDLQQSIQQQETPYIEGLLRDAMSAASASPQEETAALSNDLDWLNQAPVATVGWFGSALLDGNTNSQLQQLDYQVPQCMTFGGPNCDATFSTQFLEVAGGLSPAPAAVQQDIAACFITCTQAQGQGISNYVLAQFASNAALVQMVQGVVGQMNENNAQNSWNWACLLGGGRYATKDASGRYCFY